MNLPFIRFFKKDKSEDSSLAVASRPVAAIEKPASERLGKTVMPNSSRIVGLEPLESFPLQGVESSPAPRAPAASRKISLGGGGSIAVAPKASTSEPAAERTIALAFADLVPGLPGELLKPTPDLERRIVLKAAEVERGMATGRPTVLLRAIYKQAPEFFISEVAATDQREVALPFNKVVDQFASFQVRDDQIVDQEYPQLQTPFLKVTLEDGERFGKPALPPAAREVTAVPPELVPEAKPRAVVAMKTEAVVEAKPAVVAAAPPAAAAPAPAKPIAPIQLSKPAPASAPEPLPVPAPAITAKAPLPLDQLPPSPPITAKISPNGTGAPAAERVPASSGSPVPTPLPAPVAPLSPTRIPFKISPPSNDLRKESKFPAARKDADAIEFSTAGPRISLPLRNILRNVAPFQLTGPIDAVPETAVVEIPFSIVQPQLALGRVAISPAQFQAALPEEHRALFKVDAAGTPVPLALQDVLQNLPGESLQLRGDQEEPEVANVFETPFSQKASEDAARMKVAASPVAKNIAAATEPAPKPAVTAPESAPPQPAALPPRPARPVEAPVKSVKEAPFAPPVEIEREAAKPVPVPKAEATPLTKPEADTPAAATPMRRTALQSMLETDEPLDAKSVVGHVSRLPGVTACAIVFSDGLSLAGNIPSEYEADALCAMAPSIMKRIGEQMVGAKFGAVNGLTLFCAKTPVSLFSHGNLCLAAIHSGGEISEEVRNVLGRTTQELARMYAQSA